MEAGEGRAAERGDGGRREGRWKEAPLGSGSECGVAVVVQRPVILSCGGIPASTMLSVWGQLK